MYICTSMYVCLSVCLSLCIHVYSCMYIHTHAYSCHQTVLKIEDTGTNQNQKPNSHRWPNLLSLCHQAKVGILQARGVCAISVPCIGHHDSNLLP